MLRILSATLCVLLAAPLTADPADWAAEWPGTDFSRTVLEDWSEISPGGPPKDGIPAIRNPDFITVPEETRLDPREPVVTLEMAGTEARAFPLRYLAWHEIVNATVGGVPVSVTFCPLCGSALTFDRRVQGRIVTLGVTGKLRRSDMVMYDRETQSWWQQATGEGIVGRMAGAELRTMPSRVESWASFRTRHPDGRVMDEPGATRAYGRNPYENYDTADWPFLYDGTPPPHGIAALSRVVRVGGRAWPLERLRRDPVIREAGLELRWEAGMASPLDSGRIGEGRDIGQVRVLNEAGHDVPHDVMFAFAFDAFWPEGEWMLGE